MGMIENPKRYTARDLETIFFRPMFKGESAEQLGIRVIYNMPMPTVVPLWSPRSNVLQPFTTGWTGGESAIRKQKIIDMSKIKAEVGFSAEDYFNQIYELITNRSDVNLEDLTGTDLEKAETELFRASIAESIRTMMWIGDTDAENINLLDGFLARVYRYSQVRGVDFTGMQVDGDSVVEMLERMWAAASPALKSLKGEGNLAFFCTSNVLDAYEAHLDKFGADAAYTDMTTGRRELMYHGIRLIDMGITQYLPLDSFEGDTHCFLTDRRNLVLAVNTADDPSAEIRMWYNPDEMENRQRASFLIGCEILDESLIVRADFY